MANEGVGSGGCRTLQSDAVVEDPEEANADAIALSRHAMSGVRPRDREIVVAVLVAIAGTSGK